MGQITISAVPIAAAALLLMPVLSFGGRTAAAGHETSPAPVGMPCSRDKSPGSIIIRVACGTGTGLVILALIAFVVFNKFKRQRAQPLEGEYFQRNRGQLVRQLASQRADISEKVIMTLEELEKATNNFDQRHEIGSGGHGTVYKGILPDLHAVAIKKPKMVAILSQINHKNVVKLYGCCLETKVPLLVYEFISNGTLRDHLHVQGPISLSWDDRLRIATETASLRTYFMDDTLTTKIADFGTSRYIPLDQSGLTTVQGTLGYLDPVYLHTGRLTEKSDVYSFGVMLIELMTRKKPFDYMAIEDIILVEHFATLFAEGNLSQILDPQIMNEGGNIIEEIAGIAVACIKLRREERPTMRQVELRLQVAQSSKGFEANVNIVVDSSLPRDERIKEGLTSRQYSMEEEYMLSGRYPR
ncbi:hypothetical protein ZWY2020_054668 [Hordeum vulgare]|nr:hypothetical protein ZWY2020_054668 [Hordeum vulgare]